MNPVLNYILSTPEPYRFVLMELQAHIKRVVPMVQETYKWNLPFYTYSGRMFCFLNYRKTFVDVGFPNGDQLQQHKTYLIAGEGRKRLRSLRYSTIEDIQIEILSALLLEQAKICGKR